MNNYLPIYFFMITYLLQMGYFSLHLNNETLELIINFTCDKLQNHDLWPK